MRRILTLAALASAKTHLSLKRPRRHITVRGGGAALQPCREFSAPPIERGGALTDCRWWQSPRERARALSLAILLVQNSALTLTMRYSRTRVIEHRYHASEAVCLSELTKLFISLGLAARAEPEGESFWQRLKGAAEGAYDHPRFRAAYDFLLLREDGGENLGGVGSWWTEFQEASAEERENMLEQLPREQKPKRKARRRKPARKEN